MRTKQEKSINWQTRRDIPLSILAWFALIAVLFFLLSHISNALFLITIAAIIAYALVPLVTFFERFLPRTIAIFVVYILVFFGVGYVLYLTIEIAVQQFAVLITTTQEMLQNNTQTAPKIIQYLQRFGYFSDQLNEVIRQLATQLESLGSNAIPFLTSIISSVFDVIIIAVLSIYLLIDGTQNIAWIRANVPVSQKKRLHFSLNVLERIVGGYIRGQLILSVIIGVLVGFGMFLFQLPYAVLLGLLAFILSFIPFIGTFLSGTACVLVGLTKGWLIALFVLIYFIVIHIIEGDILGPKIVGKALGLHPVISLFAVITGTELFGLRGALFSAPVAGIIQAFIVALWAEWKQNNPKEFRKKVKKRTSYQKTTHK